MNYYISEDARKVTISGVPVIGNVRNGSFILLNENGKRLIEKIENNEDIEECFLDENLQALLDAASQSNIITKELSNTEDKGINSIYSAYVHVTNCCNLHCIGCYSDNCYRNAKEDLSFEEIKKILFELRKSGLQVLLISGGEPFLRKDIVEILMYAKKDLGIPKITVGTNGTVQKKDLYKAIRGLVDNVSISIDGYDSENADIIRDKGTFSNVIKTIKMMKKNAIPMTLLPTIHKFNYEKIPEYLELAKKLEIPLGFSLLTCNHVDTIIDKYVLSEEEFVEFVKVNTDYNCDVGDTPLDLSEVSFKVSCGAGKNMISVDASGDVYPCHMMQNSEYKLGNLLKDTLDDVLRNPKNKQFVNSTVENIESCKKCEYRYFCGGGCKARSLFRFYSLNEADMYCKGYRNNFERLGKYFYELSNDT